MWFWYGLAAAFLSAVSVSLNKRTMRNVSAPLLTWSLFAFAVPILTLFTFKDGIPSINLLFFVGTISSALLFTLAKTLTSQAIKQGILAKIVPLAVFGNFFTYILGLLVLGENISLMPLAGMVLIVFGAYILNADMRHEGILKPLTLLFSNSTTLIIIIAMILSSAGSILDKIGLLNVQPSNPAAVLLTENILSTILLSGYMSKNEKGWHKDLRKNFWPLFVNSLVYMALTLIFFYGISDGPVALVTGIKRLEILLILLSGIIFFGEKPTKHTWVASLIMILGAVLVKLN